MVAEVRLPLEDTEIDARKYDDESQGKSDPARALQGWLVSVAANRRVVICQSWAALAGCLARSRSRSASTTMAK